MSKILLKSMIFGIVAGSIFFAIAPLGLGISLIEILKPVLVPGVLIVQLMSGSNAGAPPVILAFALNIVIYTIPFFVYFLLQESRKKG